MRKCRWPSYSCLHSLTCGDKFVGFGVFETMSEPIGGPPDDAPAAVNAWKAPCANGAFFAVVAVSLLWGAFRPFRPPPEEPASFMGLLDESADASRFSEEFMPLFKERRQITDAIEERIETLEARRATSSDRTVIDAELRRLRQELLAELEMTKRLLSDKDAEWDAKKRRSDAGRREQIVRAAHEWQSGRWRVLAGAVAACALSGWLFFRASVLYRRQAVAWARATPSGCSRAPVSPCLGNADRGGPHAGDPQWHQKLMFYVVQLAVCIGAILFGLSGPAPPAGAKDKRDMLVFIGLFGLAMSTIWLFFGSIDWFWWNAIKGLVTGKRPAGEKAESKPDDR